MGTGLASLVVLMTAYVGATGYLIYRDDLLGAAVSRQVRMQYAYEERIAALRQELDRLTSRHVVQTETVEQQLGTLLDQQAQIESRQAQLDQLVAKARGAGVDVGGEGADTAGLRPSDEESSSGAPQDDVEPLSYLAPSSGNKDPISAILLKPRKVAGETTNIRPILAGVRSALNGVDAAQSNGLDALTVAAEKAADRISAALMPLGVSMPAQPDEEGEAEGGPFVPTAGLHFVERTAILNRTLDDIQSLRQAASVIPLGVPVAARHISSGFGFRVDPFLKRPAFHAGLDFVASAGTTVRATAPGTVSFAGWNGGYGQMIEIEHTVGLTTRYGHLSKILVSVGDVVAEGTPIGRVGSTGRSTGPHVHYETRRDGEAVNPATYLAAGRLLRAGL